MVIRHSGVLMTLLLSAMLVFVVDLSQARMKANVALQPGFTYKAVVTLPKGPTCVVLAPEGSSFGPAIYVGINPGFERGPDVIYKITPDGTMSEFAKLPGESDPCDLEFPPAGSPYGDFLYVSANNLDRRSGGDYGGTILRITPDGKVEYFTPVGLQPEGKPLGLGEPAGIAFGSGGAFGTSLYVANSSDAPCDIARVDASGNVEVFMNDGETGYGYGMALGPHYLDFGSGKPFTGKLYFTDYPTSSVRSADSSGGFSPPWVRLPFLRKRVYPTALKFSPGGAFGKGLYVAMRHNIYRVYPDGKFTLFATGFEWLGGDCMQFSPSENALYVVDNVDYSLFKITRADQAVAEDSIVIRGQVKDQYGEPAEGVQVCFMGQPWVGTDANGMYNLSYPLLADQKSTPLHVLLTDPEDPPRYQNELRKVSLEKGENVIDFQFNRVPAKVRIGGLDFNYHDLKLKKYLKNGEKYEVGTYDGGATVSYDYFGLGSVKHTYYYKNPGLRNTMMNLSYQGKPYAPVRIYKVHEEKQADGTTKVNQETVGHIFIDRQGNVVQGKDARDILVAMHIGMHAFGDASPHRLDEQLKFYKSLKRLLVDMGSNFGKMVAAGVAVKGVETTFALYVDVTSLNVASATMNTASSAVFFIQLANKSTSDTSLEPKTLDAVGKIVEAAKLEDAWFGLPGQIKSVKHMMSVKSGAGLTDAMDDLYPDWQSMDLDELQKKADKVDAKGKASIAQTVLDAVQFLEDTDTHTFKAMEWKVKAASLVATLNRIIKTIEGIKNGMRENQEVEDVMNLKYMCSHLTYGYAQLLEDVINYNEFRKHWTISGNMYRGLRGTAEKLGVVSEHSTEGTKQLIAAFKGDGTTDNPGMAFYQLQGYYIDLGLTFENTRWTLERVKEKNPKTE